MNDSGTSENNRPNTFSVGDYAVFAIVLALSTAVGIFYAVKDARAKSSGTKEYLLAGR